MIVEPFLPGFDKPDREQSSDETSRADFTGRQAFSAARESEITQEDIDACPQCQLGGGGCARHRAFFEKINKFPKA